VRLDGPHRVVDCLAEISLLRQIEQMVEAGGLVT